MKRRVRFADALITLPSGWVDVTDSLPEGSVPTLARENGVGALQFSKARYREGDRPSIGIPELRTILSDMAIRWGVAALERTVERDEQLKSVQADLERPGEFTRVWLVSNGDDVVLVTFLMLESSAPGCASELDEATAIVDSIELAKPPGGTTTRAG